MLVYLRPILNEKKKEGKEIGRENISYLKYWEPAKREQRYNRGGYNDLFWALLLGFIQCLIHCLIDLPL